ncbi:helix-turn-helix domain-containing protein [Cloacibacillus evryensis]|uniref:helix-turn-helix domain-containing protein n=1 Tax=Cloacibacillus evryensis TaxID=508460 RepID=UPI00346577E5
MKELDNEFIRKRITELRIKKGVSEYKMSLDLGHSRSYMQSIVSGRSLPSMAEFLYICKYLGVTPSDFFDEEIDNPALIKKALEGISRLSERDLSLLLSLIERLCTK